MDSAVPVPLHVNIGRLLPIARSNHFPELCPKGSNVRLVPWQFLRFPANSLHLNSFHQGGSDPWMRTIPGRWLALLLAFVLTCTPDNIVPSNTRDGMVLVVLSPPFGFSPFVVCRRGHQQNLLLAPVAAPCKRAYFLGLFYATGKPGAFTFRAWCRTRLRSPRLSDANGARHLSAQLRTLSLLKAVSRGLRMPNSERCSGLRSAMLMDAATDETPTGEVSG